jgi:hypothetical protein
MSAKTLVIATATSLIALFGAAGAASAGHGHGHGWHHGGHHGGLRIVIGPRYDCGYYYEQWMDTGSRYWKRKYYACKGW